MTAKQIEILELAYGKKQPIDFSATPLLRLKEISKQTGTTVQYVRMLLNGGYKIPKEVLREMYVSHLNKSTEPRKVAPKVN